MKRFLLYITLPILLLVYSMSVVGQSKGSDKEEMVKAQKIAFFTEKLSLTTDEAQKFWPVYNSYWERKNKIIEERRNSMTFCSENMDKLSPKEIERYGDLYINSHKQESDLLLEFNKKFKEVLPVEKVMKLYQADHDFKSYLLRQIRGSSQN